MSEICGRKRALMVLAYSILVCTAKGRAQNPSCDAQLQLLFARSRTKEFEATITQYQAYRQKERVNVPIYNARLNNAVVGFHKHITKDDHYKHTNCALCREYLNQIRTYSKKITNAMK